MGAGDDAALFHQDMKKHFEDRHRLVHMSISKDGAKNRITDRIDVLKKELLSCTFFRERKKIKIDALKELQTEIADKPLADAVKNVKTKYPRVGVGMFSQTEELLHLLEHGYYTYSQR